MFDQEPTMSRRQENSHSKRRKLNDHDVPNTLQKLYCESLEHEKQCNNIESKIILLIKGFVCADAIYWI